MGTIALVILAFVVIVVIVQYKEVFITLTILGIAAYFAVRYFKKKKAAAEVKSEPKEIPVSANEHSFTLPDITATPSHAENTAQPEIKPVAAPIEMPKPQPKDPRIEQFESELKAIPRVGIALSEPTPRHLLKNLPEYTFSNITRTTRFDSMFPLVFLDVETTGLAPSNCEIVDVSAIKFDYGMTPVSCFTTLCKPRRPIPASITAINHITDDMVVDAPEFRQIAPALTEFIQGCNLAGHNLDFDLRFIFAHGTDLPDGKRFYDTLDIAHNTIKKSDTYNYKLDTLCSYYGIRREQSHRSLSDCYATAKLLSCLVYDKTFRRIDRTEELTPVPEA